MMALDTLLIHAGVNQWNRHQWFRGARWKPPVLWVPDGTDAEWIRRHYLPAMREVMPTVEVRVGTPATDPVPTPTLIKTQVQGRPSALARARATDLFD